MQNSRLVPVAAGLVLLLVVVAGGFWAFSGGDAPSEPEVADTALGGAEGDQRAGDEPAEETTAGADAEPAQPAPLEEPAPETAGADQVEGAGGETAAETGPGEAAPEGVGAEEEPEDVAATAPDGEEAPAGQPTFAQSLREQDQQAGDGGTPAGATGEDGEAEPGDQDLAALGEEERPGGDEPAPPATGAAPATGALAGPDQGEEAAGAEPDDQPDGAAEDTDLAAVRTDEAPDVPAGPDGGAVALDCSADEPGCAFAETVLAAVEPEAGATPEIFLNKEDGVYLDQEYLVVEVAMPEDLGGYLYLDVYTDNGEVFHLLPEPLRRDNELEQGAMIRVGVEDDERASGVRHWQISGPFGTGYLAALVTENRLFNDLRPIGETIEAYRPVLLQALENRSVGRTALSLTPIEFRPR